ncbi:hypothetical protein AV955_gp084 [Diadromus pulchellus ascovirus 4a]|uniref:Complete DpAV4 genome n=1 Tax=Diadromus pulchellus ascovirus 4a TaxID=158683 RepID=F2NZ13_9VIRU|nr:hypothetical protein AV955_gp084 [Diadromus pulchellus ascovirus 4a]CCA61441.1 unnamed protein product [Diadromus pulchellus ascovirus 4a]
MKIYVAHDGTSLRFNPPLGEEDEARLVKFLVKDHIEASTVEFVTDKGNQTLLSDVSDLDGQLLIATVKSEPAIFSEPVSSAKIEVVPKESQASDSEDVRRQKILYALVVLPRFEAVQYEELVNDLIEAVSAHRARQEEEESGYLEVEISMKHHGGDH